MVNENGEIFGSDPESSTSNDDSKEAENVIELFPEEDALIIDLPQKSSPEDEIKKSIKRHPSSSKPHNQEQ